MIGQVVNFLRLTPSWKLGKLSPVLRFEVFNCCGVSPLRHVDIVSHALGVVVGHPVWLDCPSTL